MPPKRIVNVNAGAKAVPAAVHVVPQAAAAAPSRRSSLSSGTGTGTGTGTGNFMESEAVQQAKRKAQELQEERNRKRTIAIAAAAAAATDPADPTDSKRQRSLAAAPLALVAPVAAVSKRVGANKLPNQPPALAVPYAAPSGLENARFPPAAAAAPAGRATRRSLPQQQQQQPIEPPQSLAKSDVLAPFPDLSPLGYSANRRPSLSTDKTYYSSLYTNSGDVSSFDIAAQLSNAVPTPVVPPFRSQTQTNTQINSRGGRSGGFKATTAHNTGTVSANRKEEKIPATNSTFTATIRSHPNTGTAMDTGTATGTSTSTTRISKVLFTDDVIDGFNRRLSSTTSIQEPPIERGVRFTDNAGSATSAASAIFMPRPVVPHWESSGGSYDSYASERTKSTRSKSSTPFNRPVRNTHEYDDDDEDDDDGDNHDATNPNAIRVTQISHDEVESNISYIAFSRNWKALTAGRAAVPSIGLIALPVIGAYLAYAHSTGDSVILLQWLYASRWVAIVGVLVALAGVYVRYRLWQRQVDTDRVEALTLLMKKLLRSQYYASTEGMPSPPVPIDHIFDDVLDRLFEGEASWTGLLIAPNSQPQPQSLTSSSSSTHHFLRHVDAIKGMVAALQGARAAIRKALLKLRPKIEATMREDSRMQVNDLIINGKTTKCWRMVTSTTPFKLPQN